MITRRGLFHDDELSTSFSAWQRRSRRALLADAINGTPHHRYSYAISRAIQPYLTEFCAYGSAVVDPDEMMGRAKVIYDHLTGASLKRGSVRGG